ncbi:hypothetical protein DY000_02041680 [Brassica cretica]|uniref:Uncharacterized protein n=1 Tax=Brassica cretica TaxID=69181 RepID=A0ABQ7B8Q8_BRACR|nr:hypothetical protein DY000_02041680 [Brassica cretica]
MVDLEARVRRYLSFNICCICGSPTATMSRRPSTESKHERVASKSVCSRESSEYSVMGKRLLVLDLSTLPVTDPKSTDALPLVINTNPTISIAAYREN